MPRWLSFLCVASVGCATSETPSRHPAPAPVQVPVPQTTDQSERTERSPSSGRIEGVFLLDDGVLTALNPDELDSIARCHHAGRPFGWALLSVDPQSAISVVEAEPHVEEAASCARSSLSLRAGTTEVLIYLRFL